MRELSEGDSFGEISLLDPTMTTTAEVSSTTECLLLKLSTEKFEAFLRTAPELIPVFKAIVNKRMNNDIRALRASSGDSPPPVDFDDISPIVVSVVPPKTKV